MALEIHFKQAHEGNYRRITGKRNIEYIVVHYTANNGDTAAGNASYFAGSQLARVSSAHYFVDENEIWQSVLDKDEAYHCGTSGTYKHKYCRNANSIGVELCSRKNANGQYYFKQDTMKNGAKLVAELAEKYNIAQDHIIRHYDVTGKTCPAPMVDDEKLWGQFKCMVGQYRAGVAEPDCTENAEDDFMAEYPEWAKTTYKWIADMPAWAKESAQKAIRKGVVNTNEDNSVTIPGINLQTLVWMDRAGMLD